ncbi:protein phosphatase 2C domain-containing protein [Streptomyces sp. NPDC048424]|uniref:protein phosphatase 2C domain-containing protein n=1 Tax=Streptomyces sp. NPDC048424 TaxID=3155265 RepID=UPI0034350683
MSMHRLSGCPSCAEPLEEGDRFCGVCGYAVTAPPPAASADHPTMPIPPAPPAPSVAPAGGYGTPATPGAHHDGAAEPAPGWGSVAAAAPTLVDEPAGWSAAAQEPGLLPQPSPAEAAYGSPDRAEAAYGSPGHEGPYGTGTPPEGTAWGTGEAPYETAPYENVPQPGAAAGGKTCVACRAGHVDTDGYCEHCGHAQPRERDHLEEELGSVAAVSDRGLRHHRNEDSFAVAATALPDGSAATVAIVCDGVSSASRPDEASAAAAGAANEALLEALPRGAHPQEAMHEAILAAAAAVNALAPETPGAQNAPACTLVGAVVSGGLLTIGWVGDSRAYWVPDDRAALPRRLTEDDSWAAQMVAAGLMGEAEAYADVRAHAITGWLGADAYDLEPHTATFKPDHPGVVVVCTDGLWNYAESAREMAQVLPADAATRPLHSAQVLVGHALDGGGHDNVTVAVVPFATHPEQQPGPDAEPGPAARPEPEARPQV